MGGMQGRPEHLGPMARSLIETFAGLTLPQQRRVFDLLREILDTNEQGAALLAGHVLGDAAGPAWPDGKASP